ncbi:MAG: reductive dehalogenase [Proteobacteria bacterium]|nr:reductive dehalogenase [Pseudomonadota bacterium]
MYFDFDLDELTKKTQYVNLVERLGIDPWQGSKQEASDMVESAGKALGASQIGISLVDPRLQYKGVKIPKELKYAISIVSQWSPEGNRRVDTPLGNMSNRSGWIRQEHSEWGLKNFIRGLGYQAVTMPAPQPAYAVLAGLGELGRTNRLVSPIFGTTTNLWTLATDMPLAIDKPIDFGLQAFCKRCKKCAIHCPVGAPSMDDEPSWEPRGEWNAPGKKVYYENAPLCAAYCFRNNSSCCICFAVCPWTKQNKTVLHRISKAVSAKLPFAAKFMVKMDDIFGYGPTKDPQTLEEWWKLDLPTMGIDTERR